MTVPVTSIPAGTPELSILSLSRPAPSDLEILEYSTFWFFFCWFLFHTIRSYTGKVFPTYNLWDDSLKLKWTKRIISGLFGLACGTSGCITMYHYFLFGRVGPYQVPKSVGMIHAVWYLSIGYLIYDTITLVYYKTYLSRALIIHHVVFVLGTYYSITSNVWLCYLGTVQAYAFTDFLCHLSWIWREVAPKDHANLRNLNFITAALTGLIRIVANVINTSVFVVYGMVNWNSMDSNDKWVPIALLTLLANYVVIPPAAKLCHQTFIQKKNWHSSHRRSSEDDKVM